jgi:DNA-binding LacI/PurR family transcriptional regulator
LAREFLTSRTTASSALSVLAEDGLIVQKPGHGTRVLPPHKRAHAVKVGIGYLAYRGRRALTIEGACILEGIQDRLLARQYSHELVPFFWEERPKTPDLLLERLGAFIFVEAGGYEELLLQLEQRKVPTVVANLEMDLPLSGTYVDRRKTTRHALETLMELGHRRIALLTRSPSLTLHSEVREEYLAICHERDIPSGESLMAVGEDVIEAYCAAKRLLATEPRPTALLAARDAFGHAACRAAEEAGLVVGRDISIVGFDDISWPMEEPFLTTYREPCYELGAMAVDMLIERMSEGWKPPEKREVVAPFILRRSVGPFTEKATPR